MSRWGQCRQSVFFDFHPAKAISTTELIVGDRTTVGCAEFEYGSSSKFVVNQTDQWARQELHFCQETIHPEMCILMVIKLG